MSRASGRPIARTVKRRWPARPRWPRRFSSTHHPTAPPRHSVSCTVSTGWSRTSRTQEPLLLVVDDAHWADEPSLRFMAYLARRIESLRATLIVAARPGEPADGTTGLLAELVAEPSCELLTPGALGEPAVAELLREPCGGPGRRHIRERLPSRVRRQPVPPGRARSGAARAGRSVHRRGRRPRGRDHAAAGRPRDARPARASRRVSPRARAGDRGARRRRTARAGGRARRPRPACGGERGGSADRGGPARAGTTRCASVIRSCAPRLPSASPCRSRRPRTAERPRSCGSEASRRSGSRCICLRRRRAGTPDDAETLRHAAQRAAARGAPDAAVPLYLRLLEEPLEPGDRAATLLELGRAEYVAGQMITAAEHLEAAHRDARDPVTRARALTLLMQASSDRPTLQTLAELIEPTIAQLGPGDREVALHLRAYGILIWRPNAPTDEQIEPLGGARRRHARGGGRARAPDLPARQRRCDRRGGGGAR